MKQIWKTPVIIGFAVLSLVACKDEPVDDGNGNENGDDNSIPTVGYVVNEGGLMAENGSVSEIKEDGTVVNNAFFTANDASLGDIVQSITVVGSNGYIAVNNSQKVEVVNLEDFSNTATITGLSYPRYGLNVDGRMFLTNGSMAGMVYEIDPASNSLIDSVEVGNGPENMMLDNGNVLVANSGGWSTDSTVSVINSSTMTVTNTIEVNHNPMDFVKDANGDVWVLCKGSKEYNDQWALVGGTGPSLVKLSGSDYSVISSIELGDYTTNVQKFAISNDGMTIYYNKGMVYAMSIDATTAPLTALIADDAYGLDVDQDGNIVCLLAGDFTGNGTMKVYDTAGNLLSSSEVGIVPNGYIVK